MTDRPILFSAPMVRALLAGTKTQTRRQIKPRGNRPSLFNGDWSDGYVLDPGNESWRQQDIRIKTGDRLWVRETWSHTGDHVFSISEARLSPFGHAIYQADDNPDYPHAKFWPSIHMPREFSRMTLTVTDVLVERLQDISETDAIAEGCAQYSSSTKLSRPFNPDWKGTYREGYAELWNDINGAGAWETNPWIVAYTFTIHHCNIDKMSKEAA